ncbi:hydroxyacid dehydrogenase [Microbacterium sp. HD4P20]|uniref:hydroxyacid dehydrogenase n=1 Tax=Microbacterium sp. HD4P20 TaxID=2864874 RepID=UPI001C63EE78|nr:hydroxyacid dehydrogenase [Microbacterium sp. HD4P20]MCP2638151.1 hydroxyacid dehydrogenase [Microbacterium sp. HD4P20]
MRAALAMAPALVPFVFGEPERARLQHLVEIDMTFAATSLPAIPEPAGIDLLIAGWGVAPLEPGDLDAFPALRAIVHWGGGIGPLDAAASSRGIRISTARAVNAIPVAEFTHAMITLAAKDAFWASRRYSAEQRFIDREAELPHTGLYGTTVGLVGASTIGTLVAERLAGSDVSVLLYDPYATAETARRLGAELVGDLVELARRSGILSIHAPEMPATRGMISRDVLAVMPDGTTLINTARGSLVDQDALVAELQRGRLRAVLDVTDPEVLAPGHPLYSLPNVFLTPHLAGSTGSELRRLGQAALAEVERFVAGEPFAHPAP